MTARLNPFLPALILLAGLLPSAWLLCKFPDVPQLGLAGDDVLYIGTQDGVYVSTFLGSTWQRFGQGLPRGAG